MKKIVIIDTYPCTPLQEDILIECIMRLKPMGYSIMVVSHYPVSAKIQKLVNYYIYDDKNYFLPPDMTPHFWFDTDAFYVRIFNSGHSLAITRNIQTSLNLAKSMGYEFFYFVEFDVLFGNNDLVALNAFSEQMIAEQKKMVFFKPLTFIECGSHVYETLLFGGDVNYFLDKFQPPIDLDDWHQKKMGYTLELSFFEKLKEWEADFVIIPVHSSEYFKQSRVNVFRYGLSAALILNNLHTNQPVLFVTNSQFNSFDYFVKAYLNDVLILQNRVGLSEWLLRNLSYDGSTLEIHTFDSEIDYNNNTNANIKTFVLSPDNSQIFQKNGDIKFKLPEPMMMQHFYQSIGEDWFTYPELYKEMVKRFDNAKFVEVGSWKGRSACFMGVEIINSGKNIRMDCVDPFDYVPTQNDIQAEKFENLYEQFLENTKPVASVINPVKNLSHLASENYADNSLDFVFIDAAHDYENVRKDIICWYRKVKKGGVIAGHDYTSAEGVKRAVDEFFGADKIKVSETCWIYYVPQ
jgi:hypothetical protein